MSELSDRLKAFLTPEQRDELRLALAACDSWLNPTPPKSSDPEKVINWREGDWWSVLDDGKVLWLNSHDMCIDVVDFYKGRNCWVARINGHVRLTDSEGDARAAALGYSVRRAAKGSPEQRFQAYAEQAHAEALTPASDSAKGERDRHGRTIIARNDYAMVVECPEDGLNCCVVDLSGAWWFKDTAWVRDEFPKSGASDRETATYLLPLAARTPLPAAASLETPKHDPFPMGAGDVTGPGESPWEAIGKMAGEIYELKCEVADLKSSRAPVCTKYDPPLSGKFAPPN